MAWAKQPGRTESHYRRPVWRDGVNEQDYVGTSSNVVTCQLADADELYQKQCRTTRDESKSALAAVVKIELHRKEQKVEFDQLIADFRWGRFGQGGDEMPSTTIPRAEELDKIVKLARHGDTRALFQLRQVLDVDADYWRSAGDIGAMGRRILLDQIAANEPLLEEAAARSMRGDRERLTSLRPRSPLLRLLADDLLGDLLLLQFCRVSLSIAFQNNQSVKSWEARLHRAHRRFGRSIKLYTELYAIMNDSKTKANYA